MPTLATGDVAQYENDRCVRGSDTPFGAVRATPAAHIETLRSVGLMARSA